MIAELRFSHGTGTINATETHLRRQ